MQTRGERLEGMRKGFEERVPALARPGFVARHVRSLLKERALGAGCKVEIVRGEGTGWTTLRYAFDDGVTVYGKVYTNGMGPATFSLLRRLWENGFGPGSAERVPEPLGFCAEEKLLLMRAARGAPLKALLLREPIEQVLPGVRAAARWLARLHASTPAGLPREPPCNRVKVFDLADRLGKAAANHPEDLGLLLDRLQRLRTLAPAGREALVPTHGQYTPANVFIDGPDVVVIDVDRISLSDPAKDVAMFLFRAAALRAKEAGLPGEAERLVREFLDAYREQAALPIENLPYYTALFSLNAFAKSAKDHTAGDPVRRQAEAIHLDRFERCFPGEAPPRTDDAPRIGSRPSAFDSGARIITQYLTPHPHPPSRGDPRECKKATLVQDAGTGRVTTRYEFDAATVVFAKRYTDDLGAHSYRVQRAFWEC